MRTKHNIGFEEKTWDRLLRITKNLQKTTRRKITITDVVNDACEEYKRTEIETLHEEKKALARKINMLQTQLFAIDNTINAAVEAKEVEKEKILEKALGAKA